MQTDLWFPTHHLAVLAVAERAGLSGPELFFLALAGQLLIGTIICGLILKISAKPIGLVPTAWSSAFKAGAALEAIRIVLSLLIWQVAGSAGLLLSVLAVGVFASRVIRQIIRPAPGRERLMALLVVAGYLVVCLAVWSLTAPSDPR